MDVNASRQSCPVAGVTSTSRVTGTSEGARFTALLEVPQFIHDFSHVALVPFTRPTILPAIGILVLEVTRVGGVVLSKFREREVAFAAPLLAGVALGRAMAMESRGTR